MSVHTMKEATAGLTPQEVWARRGVYHQARRILIHPSTQYEWSPRGYLERIEFKLGGVIQVLRVNQDNGPIGDMFYLMFDEAARLIEIEKKLDAQKKDTP